jgi:hypothetical protein
MVTRTRTVWIVSAFTATAVLVAFALNARTMLGWAQPASPETSEPAARKHDRQASPELRAPKLRDDAEEACREGDWRKCENKLNHAQRLDPPGETDPRVQKLRADLDRATRLDGAVAPRGQDLQP